MLKCLVYLFLMIFNYIILFFLSKEINIVFFLFLLYIVPIAINLIFADFKKVNYAYKKYADLCFFTVFTIISFGIFSYFFEKAEWFNDFINKNHVLIDDFLEIEIAREFLNFNNILTIGIVNFIFLFLKYTLSKNKTNKKIGVISNEN